MIKDQFVVKKPETEYNWDVCKRFETEASENLSVKISYREGHLDPNSLQMPPPLKPEDLLMPSNLSIIFSLFYRIKASVCCEIW